MVCAMKQWWYNSACEMATTRFNRSGCSLFFTRCKQRLEEDVITALHFKRFMHLHSNTREYDFTIANTMSNSQQSAYPPCMTKIHKIRLVQIRTTLRALIHTSDPIQLAPLAHNYQPFLPVLYRAVLCCALLKLRCKPKNRTTMDITAVLLQNNTCSTFQTP
jgi:hypothetical protein